MNNVINLRDYQSFTSTVNKCNYRNQRMHLIAGLAAETGEVCELVQKFHRDTLSDPTLSEREISVRYQILIENMREELGDVLWYVSELATHFESDLQIIMETNINKLKKRHKK